jgi:transposase
MRGAGRAASLLLLDVRQHRAQPLVLDHCRLRHALVPVEDPERQALSPRRHLTASRPGTADGVAARSGEERRTVEAIAWRMRNGAGWRSVPAELGPWWKAAQPPIRWSRTRVWERLFAELRDAGRPELGEVFLDGSSVRAHQKAAGARGATPSAARAGGGVPRLRRPGTRARGPADPGAGVGAGRGAGAPRRRPGAGGGRARGVRPRLLVRSLARRDPTRRRRARRPGAADPPRRPAPRPRRLPAPTPRREPLGKAQGMVRRPSTGSG